MASVNQLGIKRTNGQATAQVEELYMLRYKGDEEADKVLDTLKSTSDNWYSCLSLRGTVSVGQDAASLEKIQVDQFDSPIGITVEPGDFTFECFMPSFEKGDLEAWLGEDVRALESGTDGVEGFALDLSGKVYTMSILIKSKIGPAPYMLFSRVSVSVVFGQEDKAFGLRVSGQVLAPSSASNSPVYLIKALPKQES